VCLTEHEVLGDLLDPGQFARLCRQFHGVRVDAVSALPAILPAGSTYADDDRAVEATERRDRAAQARALRRHWGMGAA
jgi:hypothetical protein